MCRSQTSESLAFKYQQELLVFKYQQIVSLFPRLQSRHEEWLTTQSVGILKDDSQHSLPTLHVSVCCLHRLWQNLASSQGYLSLAFLAKILPDHMFSTGFRGQGFTQKMELTVWGLITPLLKSTVSQFTAAEKQECGSVVYVTTNIQIALGATWTQGNLCNFTILCSLHDNTNIF